MDLTVTFYRVAINPFKIVRDARQPPEYLNITVNLQQLKKPIPIDSNSA